MKHPTIATNQMVLGDFADIANNIEPGSVDLIYTDPPYPRAQAEDCLELLAIHAHRLLKDGGSLVTIVPHYLLVEAAEILKVSGLKYRWIYKMDQEQGAHARLAMGIEVTWKPMLHYVKRAYPQRRGFVRDSVPIPAPEKDLHKWQQSEMWADYYLPRLCPPGGLVLDPFCGPGTLPAVAIKHGLQWIGVEQDPATYRAACARVDVARAIYKTGLPPL